MDTRNALLIANLTGLGLQAAGTVLDALNWIGWASLLLSLTGIGASAAAVVWSQKAIILGISRTAGRYAAKAF